MGTLVDAQARLLIPLEALHCSIGTVADANNSNTVEFEWIKIPRRAQCCHSGSPRIQPSPSSAKAAEARLSLNLRRASRKWPEEGYQGFQLHQACRRLLMMLLLSATQSVSCSSSEGEYFLTMRPMLTLLNSPFFTISCCFDPLNAGTGICDKSLCMLPFQGSVLRSKIMSLW